MKQILCFGDSNTYGLIPRGLGRFRYPDRWCGIVDEAMSQNGYHLIEEGLCGRTTVLEDPFWNGRSGAGILPILLESHCPIEIFILMLGTNDMKSCYHPTAAKIGAGIETLLDQVAAMDKRTNALLVSPIHLGEKVWQEGYCPEFDKDAPALSRQLAAEYKRIAQKRGIAFLDAAEYAAPSEEDQLHMNAQNHRRLAEGVIGALQKL